MRIRYTAVLLTVFIAVLTFWQGGVQADPGLAIASVTGSLAHGATVTIAGSLFGSKAVAPPLKYDDFQSVALGANITASTAAGPAWVNPASNQYNPVASNINLRGGTPFTRNMQSHWRGGQAGGPANSSIALLSQSFRKFIVDWWVYQDSTAIGSPGPDNFKMWRMHYQTDGPVNCFPGFGPKSSSDAVAISINGAGSGTWFGSDSDPALPGSAVWDRWVHLTYLVDSGSGNGSTDGSLIIYVNGVRRKNRIRNLQYMPSAVTTWDALYLGHYIRTDTSSGTAWNGDVRGYWEAPYVDRSWARVEIGDNPTYANATHREIQIPTSWSSSSIAVRLNRGSFPTLDGLYMYVIDEQNNASPGFCLGNCSGQRAPSAPTNVRIVR